MSNEPIVKEVLLNAEPDEVWKAITDCREMKKWYFDLKDFRPEKGFEFSFEGGPPEKTYTHRCKVTEAEMNKVISYSWKYDGEPGESLVTFEISKEGGRTKVKLTHSGLGSFNSGNPDLARENFDAGWEHIIRTSLADYVMNNREREIAS